MSAYDTIRELQAPKPITASVTVQGLTLAAAATLAPIVLQRRLPRPGELLRLSGLGYALWGRLRPGAGRPLTAG